MIRHDRKCFQSFVSSLDWYYGRLLYYAPSWLFYYNEWEHWKRNWEKLPWPKNDGLTHKNAKRRVTNNWVVVLMLFWYQTRKIISKFGKKHKSTYCKIMWFLRKATGTVLHNLELFFRGKKKSELLVSSSLNEFDLMALYLILPLEKEIVFTEKFLVLKVVLPLGLSFTCFDEDDRLNLAAVL